MRSLFILIVVQLLFIQCTSDIRDNSMDPIATTVPVTGLKAPVEFQVLRVPDHFTKADFSTHRQADFKGITSPDCNMVTSSQIQYYHPDNLPTPFFVFFPGTRYPHKRSRQFHPGRHTGHHLLTGRLCREPVCSQSGLRIQFQSRIVPAECHSHTLSGYGHD